MRSLSAFRSELRSEQPPASAALARGLGVFSLALGVAELAMPKLLARAIGIESGPKTTLLTRLMGAREIAAGVAVLLAPKSPLPLWMRVAGDAVDLSLLALATPQRTSGLRLLGAFAAVGGVTALDIAAGIKNQQHRVHANRPVIYSVTINKPPREVYAFFRNFSRLPQFMDFLESVEEHDRTRSTWTAKTAGKTVSWEAEVTEDIPGELIAWRSVEGSKVKTSGRVTFATAPGSELTEVRVEMQLGFTGIGPSAALAKMFTKPQIKGDLRRFKQVMETGEVLYSDASAVRKPHPAQPHETNPLPEPRLFIPNPPTAAKGEEGKHQ
jgi:uncharacterized membrane protein